MPVLPSHPPEVTILPSRGREAGDRSYLFRESAKSIQRSRDNYENGRVTLENAYAALTRVQDLTIALEECAARLRDRGRR